MSIIHTGQTVTNLGISFYASILTPASFLRHHVGLYKETVSFPPCVQFYLLPVVTAQTALRTFYPRFCCWTNLQQYRIKSTKIKSLELELNAVWKNTNQFYRFFKQYFLSNKILGRHCVPVVACLLYNPRVVQHHVTKYRNQMWQPCGLL